MALNAWALNAWALLAGLAVTLPSARAQDDHSGLEAAASGRAQRAYGAGDYDEARRLWLPPAEAGSPQAQLGLATLYDLGQGVQRDGATAYRWYLRAAKAGLPEAEFDVAVMCDTGDGVPDNTAEAALWYARAAAHGNRRAQYNLGLLYADGDGVPRNRDQAEAYFRAAASLPAAADKLAAMQRGGQARLAVSTGETALAPARPVAPANGSTVPVLDPAAGGASGNAVELVWDAPAEATATQFFVQLMALDAAGPREVFATTLDETAVVVPVEHVPGRYAWRVYSVEPALKHYAASAWERFEVKPRALRAP